MSVPDAAIRCGWIRRLVRDDWVELTAFGGCEFAVGDPQKKGLIISREALTENSHILKMVSFPNGRDGRHRALGIRFNWSWEAYPW